MAQKPDGKPARTERVTFTKPAAERIAKVVRAVEGGDRDAGPLTLGNRGVGGNPKAFRVCTFTGAWSINDTKTVTFRNQTATPNTVAAVNLFFPVTSTATGNTDCAIAKDGTAWFLIDVPFETATAVFASSTVLQTVFGTGSTSVIRFIGTGATQTTTYVTGVSASLNTSSCAITVSAATATATSFSMDGTQTAISVSMAGTQTITVAGATFTSTFLRFRV
jgi:hypothetical protein